MLNKTNSSDNTKFKGHELFIAQMKDQFNLVRRRRQNVLTSFLTLSEQEILLKIKPKDIYIEFISGYEQGIRKIACISDIEGDIESDVVILESDYDSRFKQLEHKDLLGAIMHLGIEREMIGDLLVEKEHLYILTKECVANYLIDSLYQIGRSSVSFSKVDSFSCTKPQYEEIKVNSASLRADALIACLAHTSRSKAMEYIKHGFVKVNDIVLEENTVLCYKDIVSIRRVGRFQLIELEGTTRKDRMVFKFYKFI